jgi:hypothetical protein
MLFFDLYKRYFPAPPSTMTAYEDIDYILAEEGRYGINDNDEIMNYGVEQIDIDEMSGGVFWSETDSDDNEPVCLAENDKTPINKLVSSDPHFGDYEPPLNDIKNRGGENYHINKLKTKPHSPKSERKLKKEKRSRDRPVKESRCHKKTGIVFDL